MWMSLKAPGPFDLQIMMLWGACGVGEPLGLIESWWHESLLGDVAHWVQALKFHSLAPLPFHSPLPVLPRYEEVRGQHSWIWNHPGDTVLDMSGREFLERLNWAERTHPDVGDPVQWAGASHSTERTMWAECQCPCPLLPDPVWLEQVLSTDCVLSNREPNSLFWVAFLRNFVTVMRKETNTLKIIDSPSPPAKSKQKFLQILKLFLPPKVSWLTHSQLIC